jgi:outer membrane protein assembly factor BamB
MRKLFFVLLCIYLAAAPVSADERSAKWSFETGDYIVASIAIHNGAVLAGSANGNLYALNSTTGDLLWKYGKVGRIESSPAVSDRMVFFGSNDGNLYAVWLNGTLAWSFKTKDKILSSPAFAYDFVYFGSSDGNFYALEAATGRMVWNYSSFSAFSSSPLASNWVIYTGSDENKLYAFQAFNGTILWSQRFPGKIQSSFTISPQNTLVFPSKDGNIYAVFAGDGSQLWNISTGTEAQSSVHYGDESGFLYFGTTDNNVYAVNSSGHIVWKYETGNWVISTPKLYHGILYVGSYDGSLYAVSTIHTAFPSNSMNASGSPALIEGESSADAGVKYVEVRVDFGEWVNASRAEKWNYSWDTSSLKDGTYTFEARSVDNNGNVELPPYAKAIIHFRSKVEMKELNVSFQPTVVVGIPIKFEVKDNEGNPVPYPQVSIFGKTYTGDEKGVVEKDDKGNFIKADNEGEFNFTVSKEGYAPPKGVLKIKAIKIIDILPYLAASILIPLLISLPVVYFLLKKFRGMKKQ